MTPAAWPRTVPVADALGLLGGLLADAVFGDPARWHPVAGFGAAATVLQSRLERDSRAAGAAFAGACVLGVAGPAAVLARAGAGRPIVRAVLAGAATWTVLGGSTLGREARGLADLLAAADVDGARARLPSLCGRDPASLAEPELVRAAVESVAENTSDAVVAPLLCGAVGGLPGLLGYRAVNTLDAMVGHRSPRYLRFGWAAARADDVANWVPARVTGVLAVALAPVVGGRPGSAWRALRRDGGRHPSPNAGRCEAAFAGALGVRLGGRNVYAGMPEERPVLGDGPPPVLADVHRAVRLSRAVSVVAALLAALARVAAVARVARSPR